MKKKWKNYKQFVKTQTIEEINMVNVLKTISIFTKILDKFTKMSLRKQLKQSAYATEMD